MSSKKQSLIHVRLENEEAIQSKRDMLSTEINIIKILQTLKRYHQLRKKELQIKSKYLRKLKETKTKLKQLKKLMPEPEIPKILREKEIKGESKKKTSKKTMPKKTTLDQELEEIQKKLRRLEQ